MNRQPSTPLPDTLDTEGAEFDTSSPFRRSYTISEGYLSRRSRPQSGRSQPKDRRNDEPIVEQVVAEGNEPTDKDEPDVGGDDGRGLDTVKLDEQSDGGLEQKESSVVEGVVSEGVTGEGVAGVDGASGGVASGGIKTLKHLESVDDRVRDSPGFKFLTRPDLYKFVKVRLVAVAMDTAVNTSSMLQCSEAVILTVL